MSIQSIQTELNNNGAKLAVDGVWGPRSEATLEDMVSVSKVRLYFDFAKFKDEFNLPKITQAFVDNINTLFEEFNSLRVDGSVNPLYVAYMLATTWHETAHTMQPIKERGSYQYLSKYDTGGLAKALGNTPGADGDGQRYAGRGYVQITGRANYSKFGQLLNLNLIGDPDLTLLPNVAASILVVGSIKGLFTGRGLGHYIRIGTLEEFKEARRVINGTDKATLIAGHALKFIKCLKVEAV